MFVENNIEKKVKERVLFENYKKRFERSPLHLCLKIMTTTTMILTMN